MVHVVAAAIAKKDSQLSQSLGSDGELMSSSALQSLTFLVARRGPEESGAGFWEFPGGKLEGEESFEQALHREIMEELSIAITIFKKIGETTCVYPKGPLRLHLYLCEALSDEISLVDHDEFLWLKAEDFSKLNWSKADLDFLPLFQPGAKV